MTKLKVAKSNKTEDPVKFLASSLEGLRDAEGKSQGWLHAACISHLMHRYPEISRKQAVEICEEFGNGAEPIW